jgi:hypothetical protein
MAICLYSALLLALQTPPPADSLAEWWRRVAADSTDTAAWLALGRAYVTRASGYHAHHPAGGDRAAAFDLDTATQALLHAAARPAGPGRDSALAYAAFAWGEATRLVWERNGLDAVAASWDSAAVPPRLPPVLEEMGENLLRACPSRGVLLTAGEADTYSTWVLRFGRGLRSDLVIIPLAIWRADTVFRARVAADLGRPDSTAAVDSVAIWRALAGRRPVCASTAFEEPPLAATRLRWRAVPLVWVTGRVRRGVPPATDFVFEAARRAHLEGGAWAAEVLAVYLRAAAIAPALCPALAAFDLADATGCERGR